MDREHSQVNSLLAKTANLIRREKEAAEDVEPTEGYKRKQVEELKLFATQHDLWININSLPLSKGGENEVFTGHEDVVFKLNNFEYAGEDIENFFIRIEAHNLFFSNVTYQMIGFAHNSQHEFYAVLVQPYVRTKREATEEEIAEHMKALGVEMVYEDEYHNAEYEVFDAVPNNVLYGIDNKLYFIDTQIIQRPIEATF